MRSERGWKSTKLQLAVLTMSVITLVYAFTGFHQAAFGEYVIGLLGAAGIYSTTNAAEKFAVRKSDPPEP